MNTNETLNNKFISKKENYPIWYYKELESVDVDYVIAYLLKETFIVDIDGSKHEITFGHNKKENYIGQCIIYNDIKNSNLCSYNVVNKGFREGQWFIITDKDTTEEFKQEYRNRKEKQIRKDTEDFYRNGLSNIIESQKNLDIIHRNLYLDEIKNATYEELEELMQHLFKRNEEKEK